MDSFRIYLSGGMDNLSIEEQTEWRRYIKSKISNDNYEYNVKPVFFDPTMYYNFEEKLHENELEILEFDLNAVRKSDLIIVNFNKPDSLGTSIEMGVAYEHRIPIIGLNESNHIVHSWLNEMCVRTFYNMEELVSYVIKFYLS